MLRPVFFCSESDRHSSCGYRSQPIPKVGEKMPDPLPSQADALRLHQRLLDDDPAAPAALAEAYLPHLIDYLAHAHHRAPADFRETAAGEAIVSLIKRPASYDPGRMELFAYLCLSAVGDLRNLMAREARHRQGRPELRRVELPPDDGKYFGTEDDPSRRLCEAEDREAPKDPAVTATLDSLTPLERRVLEFMLEGERSVAVIAAAIGLGDRPYAEQKAEVKRIKDRIKARLKRARRPT